MDLLKNFASSSGGQQQHSGEGNTEERGFEDLLNTVTGMSKKVLPGTGQEGEAKEDYLDKAVDAYQQYVAKEGSQDNENIVEQTKDEAISDAIRGQYKSFTGNDFPVADKS